MIYAETADIPPHPYDPYRPTENNFTTLHPRHDDIPPYPRTRTFENFAIKIITIFAGVWDALLKTRNVIVYLIIIIVGFLLWPIGLFLIFCFVCWIFRR